MDTQKQEAALLEVEETRAHLIALVNAKMDELRDFVLTGKFPGAGREAVWPLSTMPERFKGKKPAAILFGDERVAVTKWREVYTLVLRRCAADAACHGRIMDLRNKVHGRSRTVLSDRADSMDFPIEICEGLYAEGDFDAGALIRMLTTGVLNHAGFDYSGISVALRG